MREPLIEPNLTPDAEGVSKLRELYKTMYGRELNDDEARDVLTRLMRHVYYTTVILARVRARNGEGNRRGEPDDLERMRAVLEARKAPADPLAQGGGGRARGAAAARASRRPG